MSAIAMSPARYAEIVSEGRWKRARHLNYMNRRMIDLAARKIRRQAAFFGPRHGKALALDTPIPTPDGWTTIGDIEVGDELFAADGRPCRVVAKSPIWKDRPVYRVTTDDGDEIIADAEHEWRVRMNRKIPVFEVYNTRAIDERPNRRKPLVERQGALKTPDADLPIDPYMLGIWLRDGCYVDGVISQSEDDSIWMRSELEKLGYVTKDRSNPQQFGVSKLKVALRGIGVLGDKHIPTIYLRASETQRLHLLQGLIDTDGHVAKDGQIEFCSTNLRLASQARELVHSLGYKASLILGRATIDGRDYGEKYRVMFYMPNAARMPRKAERCRDDLARLNRYIDTEPAGRCDTACIEVDAPSHMFLCGRSMIPTHNSFFRARYFAGWYLGNFPDHRVMLAMNTAELAEDFGAYVRDDLTRWGEELFGINVDPDRNAKGNWGLIGREGSMISVGVGGPLVGRGANLFIIDDPVKLPSEAMSPIIQKKHWDWFVSVAEYRLEPDAIMMFTATPWHARDLSGRIMSGQAGDWDIVKLPALAEEDDPLGREVGEALWPERWPKEELERKRDLEPFWFDAQYQCRPRPRDGSFIKRDWFLGKRVPHAPADAVAWVRFWDRSAQAGKGDWTAGVHISKTPKGIYYIEHITRGRWRAHERDAVMLQYANVDGHKTKVGYEQEPGSSGRAEAESLARMFDGYSVEFRVSTGSKEVRAGPFASQCQAGNVYLVEGSWIEDFLSECADFPTGYHDDMVDAASGAFNMLAKTATSFDAAVGGSPLVDPGVFGYNRPAWATGGIR